MEGFWLNLKSGVKVSLLTWAASWFPSRGAGSVKPSAQSTFGDSRSHEYNSALRAERSGGMIWRYRLLQIGWSLASQDLVAQKSDLETFPGFSETSDEEKPAEEQCKSASYFLSEL